MALAMLPRFGGRLGDALVGLGVLRPIELFRAIHDQTQERLSRSSAGRRARLPSRAACARRRRRSRSGVDIYELITRGIRGGYSLRGARRDARPHAPKRSSSP